MSDFGEYGPPFSDMIEPTHVNDAFNSVRDAIQQVRQNVPNREALYDQAKQMLLNKLYGGIEGIASTPTPSDVGRHFGPNPGALSPLSTFMFSGSHAGGAMQIALAMADGVNAAMGGTPGQIQERFEDAGKNAVDNAATGLPQAFQNARDGFALSWNPIRGQSLLAEQRLQGLAGMAVDGDKLHQPPVFSKKQAGDRE